MSRDATAGGSARQAIVLIDHGSRRAAANEHLEQIARRVAERKPDVLVRCAHLEIEPPSLLEALEACIAEGATQIVVHPFFLSPGRHSQQDIPALIEEARAQHPSAEIRLSEALGLHPKLVDVVLERIDEA